MPLPKIRVYHAIFTAYGFWLPNDPRGSWSDWVRQWELALWGKATKVSTRRSVAGRPHDHHQRLAAKDSLRYPPVTFSGRQALAIGVGFKRAVEESGYVLHACSILPQHVHVVIVRHRHTAEQIVGHLKGRATQQLAADGLHPLVGHRGSDGKIPSPWAQRSWPVFLHDDEEILRAIGYVQRNPAKEGKRPQRWSFITPFAPA